MSENVLVIKEENVDLIFCETNPLVIDSRNRVYSVVNTEMLHLYWSIGKIIMEIQEGNERAKYGDKVLENLSEKLTDEFGKHCLPN